MSPSPSSKPKRLKSVPWNFKQRHIATLVLVLARSSLLQASYLCEYLVDNTWESFRDLVETNVGGIVILCPFSISGEDCPAIEEVGYTVPSWTNLYVMCEPLYSASPPQSSTGNGGSTGCILDCPGTHFSVAEYASLALDGITLKGSRNSSIWVQSNGSLTTFNTFFEE